MSYATNRSNGRRDTSRDGFRNRLQTFALTHFSPLWSLAQSAEWIRKPINTILINSAIEKPPPRPFPLSTVGCDPTTHRSVRMVSLPPPHHRAECLWEPPVAAWSGVGYLFKSL